MTPTPAPGRASRFGASPSGSAASRRSTTSPSVSSPAASPASSARTAPARPPPCGCCSAWSGRPRGTATIGGAAYDDIPTPLLDGRLPPSRRRLPPRPQRAQPPARAWRPRSGIPAPRGSTRCSTWSGIAGGRPPRAGGYSLGMRQRLGLAAALLGDPQVLILDEPANGLDPEGIRWLRGFLRDLADRGQDGPGLQPPAAGGRADRRRRRHHRQRAHASRRAR